MIEEFKSFFDPLTSFKAISILIIVGIIIFSVSLFNDFVIDDDLIIKSNIFINSFKNIPMFYSGGVFYTGGELVSNYYRPFMMTLFTVIASIFGPNAFWFHLAQVSIHILNSIILYLVFRSFFKANTSLILSLVFLIHPLNSETAYYISATQDALFFLLGISAFWLIVNFKKDFHLVIVGVLFLLSLLSKETGALFILSALLYVLFFNKKIFFKLVGVSFVTVLVYIAIRIKASVLFVTPDNAPITLLNFGERLINIPSVITLYITNFFIPYHISSSYQWVYKSISFTNFFIPILLIIFFLVAIVVIGILIYRYKINFLKIYVFFTFLLMIGLLLHSQIIPLDSTAALRWFYFPIVGILGMIGVILSIFEKYKLINFVVIIVIIIFSVITFDRGFDWKNNYALASNDIKISKESHDTNSLLAVSLVMQGKNDEALPYAIKAAELHPSVLTFNALGVVYLNLKEYDKSEKAFLDALSKGDYAASFDNLVLIKLIKGDFDQAINLIDNGLQVFPNDSKLWIFLGIALYETGRKEEALAAISKSFNIDNNTTAHTIYLRMINDQPLGIDFSR